MSSPDVYDMVKSYLKENGYDGLVDQARECACLIDDLAPCGEMKETCCAGYRTNCDADCLMGPCDFHIK